jgi:hypothetical protein
MEELEEIEKSNLTWLNSQDRSQQNIDDEMSVNFEGDQIEATTSIKEAKAQMLATIMKDSLMKTLEDKNLSDQEKQASK